ncbi:hypothetical protein RCH22_003720 [Cryobacterium psychrotolerans]|nr:hypothetical protein [Cryobacterium psychrotolerans]
MGYMFASGAVSALRKRRRARSAARTAAVPIEAITPDEAVATTPVATPVSPTALSTAAASTPEPAAPGSPWR